jgi:CRISPR-associated protein Cas8a1/Csx13
MINLAGEEHEGPKIVSYKPVDSYAHMNAQGTDLFKREPDWPQVAKVPQSVVPGALSGAVGLEVSGNEAFLLLYLIVGCPLYATRGADQDKYQYAVVVPNVVQLQEYAETLQRWMRSEHNSAELFGFVERVAGGIEEAAMHFLLQMEANRIVKRRGVKAGGVGGCLTFSMGKVPWDKNQMNRSLTKEIRWDYEEREVFRAAKSSVLGQNRIVVKEDKVYVFPASAVPALIAANLGSGQPWYAGLANLMAEQKDFNRLMSMRGGFREMYDQIRNEQDRMFIETFHEAWRRTLAQLGERSTKEGLQFSRLCEVERERMRNTILRLRTSEALANWFLQFCASATRGGVLPAVRSNMGEMHEFLFSPRNFARLQNLSLFALLSYQGKEEEVNNDKGAAKQ